MFFYNPIKIVICTLMAFALISLTGCYSAHVSYGLGNVKCAENKGPYSAKTLTVPEFENLRYKNKKSVATFANKNSVYNRGLEFKRANLSDYDDVFKGMKMDDLSFYSAPDRLYWTPSGPLADMRTILIKHIAKTDIFRTVSHDNDKSDYLLNVKVKELLGLKERNPVADGLGFLGISSLFSGYELSTSKVEWKLVRRSDGVIEKEGNVNFRNLERHNNFRAKNKPFKLIKNAAKATNEKIVQELSK